LSPVERVGILDKLIEYLAKLKSRLDDVGKEWGVESYSLGVGFTGVEVTLNFKL